MNNVQPDGQRRWRAAAGIAAVILACAGSWGCNRSQTKLPPTTAAKVLVSTPITGTVTDYEEFTGQTEAMRTILVRARVTGYLDRVLFTEGAEVKQGDSLFVIDQRTYQAEVDRAQANLTQARAHLARLQLDYNRFEKLLPTKAISQEDFDKASGDRDEAAAAVKVAEAALQSARLNLDFTTVRAPISGRISRQMIDAGNMVRADDTPLTTIVSLDSIYAYFDVDERTMLRIRRLFQAGKIKAEKEFQVKVELGLTDEEGFPHQGTVNFVDNRLDVTTGTLRLRAVVDNKRQLFSPGMFVRIRLPVGEPHTAMLVAEQAVGSDQGNKFVYVVNGKQEVMLRRVRAGSLHNGMRVIEDGLTMGERVILSGLQRVRPGLTVDPKVVEMTGQ
jgi:RND family efflux transporter MFP subunit